MSIRKMCAEGEDAGEFFGRYTEDQYCDQCLQIVVTMMTRPKDKREILIMLSGYSVFVADQHHPVCLSNSIIPVSTPTTTTSESEIRRFSLISCDSMQAARELRLEEQGWNGYRS